MRDGTPVAQLISYAEKPKNKLKLVWARNQVIRVTPSCHTGVGEGDGDKEVKAMFGGGL